MVSQLIERIKQLGPFSECVLVETGKPVYSMRAVTSLGPKAIRIPIRGWVRINGTVYTVGSYFRLEEIPDEPLDLAQMEPEEAERSAQLLIVRRYGKEIDLS